VLLNLAVNARDAMPSGGKLSIEMANVELDGAFTSRHPGSTTGPHVMLAVSDTGCGMTDEVKARLFEPFFTTKEAGKGSGLGLSTVYGIIKQSGGSIWVYSELGVGTSFKIYLPRTDSPTPSEPDSTAKQEHVGGTETILVVEDQDEVRRVIEVTLGRRGYTVLAATGAQEAERLLDAHTGAVHLLLTDVVMPSVSGRQLAESLLRRQPHLRVLYMSGYTDDAIVRHGVLAGEMAFLEKPFTNATLLRAVRMALDTG
jgi:CheY-like chemotaxis protein